MNFGDSGLDMIAALLGKPTKPCGHRDLGPGEMSIARYGQCGCPIPYNTVDPAYQAYMRQLAIARTMNELAAANAIGDIAGMATAFIKPSPRELTHDEVYERDARRELEDYLGDLPEVVLFDVRFAE